MNSLRHLLVVSGVALWALMAQGLEDVEIGPGDGFKGVVNAANAKMTRTPEALVFTDIRYDMQITVRTPPIHPGNVESIEFKYRVSGPTQHPKAGGELFFSGIDGHFTDTCKFRLPKLQRDGEWHVVSVSPEALEVPGSWISCGVMTKFRFDPTNADGGQLEIAYLRFRMRGTAARNAVAGEKFQGEDKWPELIPDTFTNNSSRAVFTSRAVSVSCRGGAATPRVQTAGRKVRLRYDFRGPVPEGAYLPATMAILSTTGSAKWSEEVQIPLPPAVTRLREDVWSLTFDYELPLYLDTTEAILCLGSPSLQIVSGRAAEAHVKINRIAVDPAWTRAPSVTVKDVAGSPAFAVNGKPVYPLWGTVAYGRRKDIPGRHSSAPLNFVTVWTRHLEWWPRGEEFDPTDLDRLAEQHRRAHPDAYFMWDISIYPPPDWRDANPDEMARDEQGFVNRDCGDAEINFSFASQKAYVDMARIMKKVIDHLEHSPYANRIAGYRINSGHTVEWLGWDPTRKETILDFSPVAQKGFEAFAKAHYPWITDFSVPTLAERRALDAEEGVLWNQRAHARAIAYHDFYSTAVADGAIRMCRAAREFLGGQKKLIGTYYGYVMTLNGGGRNQMRAHYAMKHFLDAQAVDFIMSPQNYATTSRQPGSETCDMKPFRSIQNHGIVSVIEDDTRTHNICRVGYSQTLNEEMSVNILRRNMGAYLCRNQPFYTYAITSGCEFDFPQFADDAAALRVAGQHALEAGVRRAAEVAVVISEEAIKSTPMYHHVAEQYVGAPMQIYANDGTVKRLDIIGGTPNASWPYVNFYTECARIGAGCDFVLAEDLVDNPGDYKLYIMQVCTKSTPALLQAAAKLRERNCTILWTFAPGYTAESGNSTANMTALTGMRFAREAAVTDPGVTLLDGTKMGGLVNPKGYAALAPIFSAVQPDKVLGRYANGAAGLAESRTGQARTVFSGSYFLQGPFLHRLAKESGVHLFSDSLDICEANSGFVSLHARNAGTKTIRLPKRTSVIDVFNRRRMAKDVDRIMFDATLHSSWLFYYGDDAEELLKKL